MYIYRHIYINIYIYIIYINNVYIYIYIYIYMCSNDLRLHIAGTNEPKSAKQAKQGVYYKWS